MLLVFTAALPIGAAAQKGDSATDVIASRCLSCHDSTKRSGGVDLSTHAAALAANQSGRVLRMVSAGKMPPTGRLPDSDVALLKRWIQSGAPYPREPLVAIRPAMMPLWSFQPVKRPAIPHSPFDSLSANPIDRFLFAKLAARGLKPSAPAGRLELIRRVTVDLTGLPPTPEEVAAFLQDRSPNAYEKVVDRVLASPAYGERWGRHWLDVVRYGESNGYEQNHLRSNAWPYRDYVIRAFNDDKPYPQFIAEQLAGDVIGKGDSKVEVATGFLVAGVHDTVGIQTDEGTRQQRSNDLDDIVSTTGAAFLGLTVGCAKCHDHKFDPIPQRDFYRLAACFAGVRHEERALPPSPDSQRHASEIASMRARLQVIQNEIGEMELQARESVLRTRGKSAARPAVNARRNVDSFAPVRARFVRFTVLATRDATEPCIDELQVFGPGSNENLALATRGGRASASSLLPNVAIHQVAHLNDGLFGNDHSWISATKGTGWAQIELPSPVTVDRVVWSRDAADIPRFDDRVPVRYRIDVSLDGNHFQTVSTDAGRAVGGDYIHPDALLAVMSATQKEKHASLKVERDKISRRLTELTGQDKAYIGTFSAPDPIYVLNRGDVMQRGEQVTPGGLSQITALQSDLTPASRSEASGPQLASIENRKPKIENESDRRLALARWIGDARNPLTARVMVNRVWQYHFGRGIVGTPSDFGRNGEKATHPELLDWLAAEFSRQASVGSPESAAAEARTYSQPSTFNRQPSFAWRLKPLHRLIVTSYAYRQTSASNPKGMAVDAGNTLIWRMPLRRMEAEALRDAILQASGKLDRRIGGPGFLLFKYRVVNIAIFEPLDTYGPETWRRSVYQHAARSNREELLGAFDCPECAQREPRRPSTTTALQALTLLNGAFTQQQAGFFADRVKKESSGSIDTQVRRAFQIAFGRSPESAEFKAGIDLFRADGLTALCRALLNANEFLYY